MGSRATLLLPSRDRERERVVRDAAVTLRRRGMKVEKIGRRRWHVNGTEMGTTRMVSLSNACLALDRLGR